MRERRWRVNPLQTMFVQRQRRKEWRASREGMDRGTKVVEEARERELQGARGAAGLRLGPENLDVRATLRKDNGRGQAVGSRTDDAGSSNHGLAPRQFTAAAENVS